MANDNVDWRALVQIGEQQLKEFQGMQDAFRGQHAILMRLDAGQFRLLEELHAMHTQMARVLDRLEQNDRRIGTLERNNPPPSPIPPAD